MKRAVSFALTAALACSHAPSLERPAGYAKSRDAAVELCLPMGERKWLASLRCPGGERPVFRELGSAGPRTQPVDPDDPRLLRQLDISGVLSPGEPDFHAVDAVEARCGERRETLFLDAFHCAERAPREAPAGYDKEPEE